VVGRVKKKLGLQGITEVELVAEPFSSLLTLLINKESV
jgi:hypothetical protein